MSKCPRALAHHIGLILKTVASAHTSGDAAASNVARGCERCIRNKLGRPLAMYIGFLSRVTIPNALAVDFTAVLLVAPQALFRVTNKRGRRLALKIRLTAAISVGHA